jgi:threonyl-tRNA synthetase
MDISSKYDNQEVSIPHIAKRELYELSGHAAKFEHELFRVESHYGVEFVLKPVNCPHHIQIFDSKPITYKDLPVRYIESTIQYRDEKPGQIGGLSRTRGFLVDDGHTFCRVDQIKEEITSLVKIIEEFYSSFGFYGDHWVSLSVRDPRKLDDYVGERSDWDQAEAMLDEVNRELGLEARRMEGEAAIYGPKLDFMYRDALGHDIQLSTIQLDFAMPRRFGLSYTDAAGGKETPVIIHRAIAGSYERFMVILLEKFAGAFPAWLAPEQIRLATVNESQPVADYAAKLKTEMKAAGLRVELDDRNESVGKKIREAEMMKVPYTIVIGEEEVKSNTLKPRIHKGYAPRDAASEIEADNFIKTVVHEVATRASKSSV